MNRSWAAFWAAVVLAAAIVLTAKIGSETVLSLKMKGELNVKGFAKKTIVSDLGTFNATLAVEGLDLKVCYETLSASKEKTVAYLKSKQLTESEFKFEPAFLEEKYMIHPRGHVTNKLEKYVLSQTVEIQSQDVQKVSRVASDIVELLNQGIHLNIDRPQYYYTPLDGIKAEMIGLATENAKTRASVIASKGGFRLGAVKQVRVGVFQITPMNSTDVSDSGINDNSSIEKEIKSVVEIGYFVQ